MRAYSTDLRAKLVLAYEAGEGTLDEVAETFGVGRCPVASMMKLWRTGQSLLPLPHGGGAQATLDEKLLALLREQVAAQPDATLSELAADLRRQAKVAVYLSTVCRALQKLGLPRKKSLAAAERVEADRQAFRRRVARLDRRRFVFTDETGFHLAMTRADGRAGRGPRVGARAPRNHGLGVSLIGSLGLRGLRAPLSIEGAVDTLIFDAYLRQVLVARLRPKDMLLLDNLPVHQASQVEQVVAEVKAEVLWLPAYSPDFSPIENCWSKVKTLVPGRRPRTPKELNVALRDALKAVSLDDIEGWFKHCGY